ncbi:hypothetical protein ACLOJK_024033 [Asimina triloba]
MNQQAPPKNQTQSEADPAITTPITASRPATIDHGSSNHEPQRKIQQIMASGSIITCRPPNHLGLHRMAWTAAGSQSISNRNHESRAAATH